LASISAHNFEVIMFRGGGGIIADLFYFRDHSRKHRQRTFHLSFYHSPMTKKYMIAGLYVGSDSRPCSMKMTLALWHAYRLDRIENPYRYKGK